MKFNYQYSGEVKSNVKRCEANLSIVQEKEAQMKENVRIRSPVVNVQNI